MSNLISRSGPPKIEEGSAVTLHFSLLYPTGEEIDTTRNGKPARCVIGDGSLLPGFEAVLMGNEAGFSEQILIPAEDAFGERNPANIRTMDAGRFDMPLEEGLIVSFQAPDGELPGVVREIRGSVIEVDFNHPLAGSDIVFDVTVISVEDRG